MDKQGEIQSSVFFEQCPQLECFVRCLTYHRALSSCRKTFEDQDFLDEACDAFLFVAILAWCNVFGSCGSDFHWSKLIKNMPEKLKLDFKDRIYRSTRLNEDEHQKCRNYIKTLRDKYLAHRDRNWQKHIRNSPDFENALKIAKVYECWVNDLLQKESSPSMNSLTDLIESAEREVKHVTALLRSQER